MHHRRRDGTLVAIEQILLAGAIDIALGVVGLAQPHGANRSGSEGLACHVRLRLAQLFFQLVFLQLIAHLLLAHRLLEARIRRRLHHDDRPRRRRRLPRAGQSRKRHRQRGDPQAKRRVRFERHEGDAMMRSRRIVRNRL